MVRIEDSARIDRPLGDVRKFISDPRNNQKWFEGALDMKRIPEGPLAVGDTTEAVVRIRNRPVMIGARCTVVDKNRELTWEFTSGPTKGSADNWKLEPVNEKSTRLTRVFDLKTGGSWRLLQPIIVQGTRKSHEAEMTAIKRILEGNPEP